METAGGVHSPSPSGSTQADLYAPFRLPVILIGDAKLGGISQTVSAFESLKIRGYDVEAVLIFREEKYQNHVYLAGYFRDQHGIPVKTAPEPPKRVGEADADADNMLRYYEDVCGSSSMTDVLAHLDTRHQQRILRLGSMRTAAHKTIWFPFTQHNHLPSDKITVIDSARGDEFQILAPKALPGTQDAQDALLRPSFDGSASWWTQGLGHGNPTLSLAAAYAAGRYGHVMFADAVHEPALALAETLLSNMANPRLTRVFYSDNGSTGAEVAVKMALRAARLRYGWPVDEKAGVLGLKGSYHGDTIGAMDCSEPCVFNEKVEWYQGKGFWFDYPTIRCSAGRWLLEVPAEIGGVSDGGSQEFSFRSLSDVFDVQGREARGEGEIYVRFVTDTLKRLRSEGRRFGALMIEPVVLGAGGMLLV